MYLEQLRNTTKHVSEDNLCTGRDSNEAPLECQYTALPLFEPARSVTKLRITQTHCIEFWMVKKAVNILTIVLSACKRALPTSMSR